jgi:hypothetical protein
MDGEVAYSAFYGAMGIPCSRSGKIWGILGESAFLPTAGALMLRDVFDLESPVLKHRRCFHP